MPITPALKGGGRRITVMIIIINLACFRINMAESVFRQLN